MRTFGFLASLGFTSWKPEEVVRRLAELGYQAVEWPLAHYNPQTKGRDALSRLVRVSVAAGLEVSEVGAQHDMLTLDEDLRRSRVNLVRECIQVAGDAGVKVVNIFTGPAPWDPEAPRLGVDLSEGEAWDIIQQVFDELVLVAERSGVYLAVEAVFGHLAHDYYTVQELLRRYDSPRLGINMDPSHYRLYGNDIPWVIRQLGPRIYHVHLKDVIGRPGVHGKDFMFPMLGEGLIDWRAFVAALDEIGYTGALSVEFESFTYYRTVLKDDPVKAAAISMEQIKALFPA
ncbi:MAG TPA: sugar phosphate isomerase/epimerase [Caldilineae bacterium]|nr:sugar phosphate isomerase/epimerase [Caldilineae bacterium]